LYAAAWVLCSALLRVWFGFRAYGRHHIPRSGGVILAINHQSYLDPVVVGCGSRRPVHFMARDTLFRGVFGLLIRALNAFPVVRGGGDVAALKQYIARVRGGKVVMLFPEGTRSRDGRIQRLLPGVGMLAVRAGAPVVPTYVSGTFDAWPRHRSLPRHAEIAIRFGSAITVERRDGESKRQHQERIRTAIDRRLRALEAQYGRTRRGQG
jgi:1-acyl-sn-glycerol-3-phosphate acyltransferase